MRFGDDDQGQLHPEEFIPVGIQVKDYPQLKKLAWQLKAGTELTPIEALGVYERIFVTSIKRCLTLQRKP